jgi:hypothetical protein
LLLILFPPGFVVAYLRLGDDHKVYPLRRKQAPPRQTKKFFARRVVRLRILKILAKYKPKRAPIVIPAKAPDPLPENLAIGQKAGYFK